MGRSTVARPKEFDPDIALDRALELFWEKGYEATSMADLVQHLGIGRASLYATFGSKHDLYLKALDRYLLKADPNPLEFLSGPGPPSRWCALGGTLRPRRGLRREKAGLHDRQHGDRAVPEDRLVARRIEMAWDGLEAALAAALDRAQAQGELASDKDPPLLPGLSLSFCKASAFVAKAAPDPDRVHDVAKEALAVLG